jgi:hypothetical protein
MILLNISKANGHTLVNNPTAAVQNTNILLDRYLNSIGRFIFEQVDGGGLVDVIVLVLTDKDICEGKGVILTERWDFFFFLSTEIRFA